MDGFSGSAAVFDAGVETARPYLTLSIPTDLRPSAIEGLSQIRFDDLDTLVVTKTVAGFDASVTQHLRTLLRDAAAGRLGRLKFLVVDFAHSGEADVADEQFGALVTEAANLILQAPIVLIANVRGAMAGPDLEFALACSMMIGEQGGRFSFAADPVDAMQTYGFLAQKLGFVRAERLMEGGDVLNADQMRELFLLKDIAEDGQGIEGVRAFLSRTARRHNSCYGIYRAHRMASPTVREALRAAS